MLGVEVEWLLVVVMADLGVGEEVGECVLG